MGDPALPRALEIAGGLTGGPVSFPQSDFA